MKYLALCLLILFSCRKSTMDERPEPVFIDDYVQKDCSVYEMIITNKPKEVFVSVNLMGSCEGLTEGTYIKSYASFLKKEAAMFSGKKAEVRFDISTFNNNEIKTPLLKVTEEALKGRAVHITKASKDEVHVVIE